MAQNIKGNVKWILPAAFLLVTIIALVYHNSRNDGLSLLLAMNDSIAHNNFTREIKPTPASCPEMEFERKNSTKKFKNLPQCRPSNKETIQRDYMLLETTNLWPYIRPDEITTIIEPERSCGNESIYLLIVVYSAPFHIENREAIRTTWKRDLHLIKCDIRIFFVVGATHNETLNAQVMEEARIYDDIVEEDFCDSYFNLTLKNVFSLKWTLQRCSHAKYFLKADDDSFIHPNNLIKLLEYYDNESNLRDFPDLNGKVKNPPSKYILVGDLYPDSSVLRKPDSPFYLPRYVYDAKMLPKYFHGSSGWLITGSLLPILYKESLETPFMHIEDVFFTGLVAGIGLKLSLDDRKDFYYDFDCKASEYIVLSDYTPEMLIKMWARSNDSITRTEFNICEK